MADADIVLAIQEALAEIFEDTWSMSPSEEQQTEAQRGDLSCSGSQVSDSTDLASSGGGIGAHPYRVPASSPTLSTKRSTGTRGRSQHLLFISYPYLNHSRRKRVPLF